MVVIISAANSYPMAKYMAQVKFMNQGHEYFIT